MTYMNSDRIKFNALAKHQYFHQAQCGIISNITAKKTMNSFIRAFTQSIMEYRGKYAKFKTILSPDELNTIEFHNQCGFSHDFADVVFNNTYYYSTEKMAHGIKTKILLVTKFEVMHDEEYYKKLPIWTMNFPDVIDLSKISKIIEVLDQKMIVEKVSNKLSSI